MDRELLGNDRIGLINAISQGDFAAINRFAERWPKLDVKLDVAGNSALHYAVARCYVQVVSHLLEVIGVDVAVQNRHGETPYNWWSDFVKSSVKFKKIEGVTLVLEAVKQGDTDALIEGPGREVSPRIRFLVEGSIGTVLHWGIHWHQSDSVKVWLANINDDSFLNLLTIRDSQGTPPPPLLASEKSQQRDTKATDILKYLQERQHAIEANQSVHAQPQPAKHIVMLMPADYEQHLVMLKTKLFDGVKENDYPWLRPALPTLCALAHYTCQEALQQFGHQPFLENQALLLKRLSGNGLVRLRQTIEMTTAYLGDMLQNDCVHQVIELCVRFPDGQTPGDGRVGIAFSDIRNEKIYLNLTELLKESSIVEAVETVIHEMSHLAAGTYDFAVAENLFDETGETIFHLNQCIQLAEKAEYDPVFSDPVEKRQVEDIARLLEPIGDQQPRVSLGQCLATQNADTTALAAMGISAIAAGFGAFVNRASPPINRYTRQDLRGEWLALELDRGFFSNHRIKGMLEKSDAISCRPQTPPPNGAIDRDSDEEKLLPTGPCHRPLISANVPKLREAMLECAGLEVAANSPYGINQSNSECSTGRLALNNARQVSGVEG